MDDLIEGFIRVINSPDDLAGPIDLGNPSEFTMIEPAGTARDLTGSRSPLIHEPPQDDPKQRQPDVGLAKEHLGWKPTIPLPDGLKATIAYFAELLRQQASKT